MLPVAAAFPLVWAAAPSRLAAAFVSAGYFLAGSFDLPRGVANFYGHGSGAGICFWFVASLSFVAVHTALWTRRSGWKKALRYAVAAVLMSIPPFGILGWGHPLTAAGIVFPGWGWWGLTAMATILLAMTTRAWWVAAVVVGLLSLRSAWLWTDPVTPENWTGIQTSFGSGADQDLALSQQLETLEMVRAAGNDGAKVVVLPESALGMWTPTIERLWVRSLAGHDLTMLAGAILVNETGYDNVILQITNAGATVVYRQRMPVPISMWQPWQGWWGLPTGVTANPLANPTFELGMVRVAPLICYEQLLVWPVLQSAWHAPDAIVAIANGWWTRGTSILEVQQASTVAWAKLFDLPLILSAND